LQAAQLVLVFLTAVSKGPILSIEVLLFESEESCMPKKILMLHSRGKEVIAVQRQLNRYFCPPLVVDGVYGRKTEAAVRRFQVSAGFRGRDVDGKVGPKTMVALFQIFDMEICGLLVPKSNVLPTPINPPTRKPPTDPTNQLPKPMPLLSDQTKGKNILDAPK
jgi:peptidoglycan hydrolase-like protein with peptidoglycan-binding domain